MKRSFLITVLFITLTTAAHAQDRKIEFEATKAWTEILDKAKEQDKLIFVDCYTDWCGPCRSLASQVFTRNDVADFFNINFVNVKFEMEKDADGVAHKDSWGIRAYPTLLFVDPYSEEVIHRLVGAGNGEWLIEGGRIAQDSSRNMKGAMLRYKNGDRSPGFISEYLAVLKSAYMKEELVEVTEEFLCMLDLEELATEENWLLIHEYVDNPLSRPLRLVMENRQLFYEIAGREAVDTHLGNTIINMAKTAGRGARTGGPDVEDASKFREYLTSIEDFPAKEQALAYLDAAQMAREGNWDGFLSQIASAEKNDIFPGDEFWGFFWYNIEKLTLSNDVKAVERGVTMIDEKITKAGNNHFQKAFLAQSKHRLLKSIDDKPGAEKAKLEEEEYFKEGYAAADE